MLAIQHRPNTSQFQPHAFLPTTPSPLSPRRNSQDVFNSFGQPISHVPRSIFNLSMNASDQQQTQTSTSRSLDRKYRPELHGTTRGALAQKRRDIFHRKVQNQRDDKTWARRGEELERLDDRNEWRRWEREALSLAPEIDADELEEGEGNTRLSLEEAEEIAQMEERELAALVEMMDVEEGANSDMTVESRADQDEHFGSDDEDYESIFAGLECDASHQAGLHHVAQREGVVTNQGPEQEAEEMDLS